MKLIVEASRQGKLAKLAGEARRILDQSEAVLEVVAPPDAWDTLRQYPGIAYGKPERKGALIKAEAFGIEAHGWLDWVEIEGVRGVCAKVRFMTDRPGTATHHPYAHKILEVELVGPSHLRFPAAESPDWIVVDDFKGDFDKSEFRIVFATQLLGALLDEHDARNAD